MENNHHDTSWTSDSVFPLIAILFHRRSPPKYGALDGALASNQGKSQITLISSIVCVVFSGVVRVWSKGAAAAISQSQEPTQGSGLLAALGR